MDKRQRHYLSYLLRLWKVQRGEDWSWRASLEGARSGEQASFATLEALFAFVRQQTLTASDPERERIRQQNDVTVDNERRVRIDD